MSSSIDVCVLFFFSEVLSAGVRCESWLSLIGECYRRSFIKLLFIQLLFNRLLVLMESWKRGVGISHAFRSRRGDSHRDIYSIKPAWRQSAACVIHLLTNVVNNVSSERRKKLWTPNSPLRRIPIWRRLEISGLITKTFAVK